METELEAIQRRRQWLRSEFGALYDRVSVILFEEDPAGVNFEHNTDEYESEVELILPSLRSCSSEEDVQRAVHAAFLKMFSEETANPSDRFRRIAGLIWAEISSLSTARRP
jgi:hypothetical protein